MSKNILITWHIPSYGIGYFKNVLSAFYKGMISLNQKETLEAMSQIDLERGFFKPNGFLFDKVYYLCFSDKASGKISDRTKTDYVSGRAKVELVNDDLIKKEKTLKVWEDIFRLNFGSIKEELNFVKEKYPEKYDLFLSQYWRNIHYYPISQQMEWFKEFSNVSNIYGPDKIEFVDISKMYGIDDLRDEDALTSAFYKVFNEITKVDSKSNYFFSSGLGTMEMQLAFRNVISDSRFDKFNISLFSIVDQKENTKVNYRFRDLKYSLKNPHKTKTPITVKSDQPYKVKDYHEFSVYPSQIVPIKFCEISFITTCHADKSRNDRYLQKIDGKFYRITKVSLDNLEALLPNQNFLRINKSTIISNHNRNIQGWSRNFEHVQLSCAYVNNSGLYNGSKKSEQEYKKGLVGKPVEFNISSDCKEKFEQWDKLI